VHPDGYSKLFHQAKGAMQFLVRKTGSRQVTAEQGSADGHFTIGDGNRDLAPENLELMVRARHFAGRQHAAHLIGAEHAAVPHDPIPDASVARQFEAVPDVCRNPDRNHESQALVMGAAGSAVSFRGLFEKNRDPIDARNFAKLHAKAFNKGSQIQPFIGESIKIASDWTVG